MNKLYQSRVVIGKKYDFVREIIDPNRLGAKFLNNSNSNR